MQHISAESLEDLPSRIAYLSSFLHLTQEDVDALLAAKPLIAPLVPTVLDLVYSKLLSYDITASKFVPKNSGYEGVTVNSVEELTLESDIIKYRKDFLKNYLVKLVSTTDLSPDSPFWVYLNNVGIMHTGQPGFKYRAKRPELRVEYIHMGVLLGYVVDVVIGAVMEMSEETVSTAMKSKALRALNKVVWIQNDLFARHYVKDIEVDKVKVPLNGEGANASDAKCEGCSCPFAGKSEKF